jgi:hypothetical protein
MTRSDFSQLLSSIKALSPEQARQVRQQLDSKLIHSDPRSETQPKKTPARTSGKRARRVTDAPQKPKKPLTREEFDQHLLDIGLMSQLPDTEADFDDPDDQLVEIKGEPLSETIIRERR